MHGLKGCCDPNDPNDLDMIAQLTRRVLAAWRSKSPATKQIRRYRAASRTLRHHSRWLHTAADFYDALAADDSRTATAEFELFRDTIPDTLIEEHLLTRILTGEALDCLTSED